MYVKKQTANLSYTHTQYFKGFVSYMKLIFCFFSNKTMDLFTPYQKIKTFIIFVLTGFFKSFLYFFKVVEKIQGTYTIFFNKIDTELLTKTTIVYFLFIPIWFFQRKATVKDLEKRKILQ